MKMLKEKKVKIRQLYTSLDFVLYLEWCSFSIILYEYKLQEKHYLNSSSRVLMITWHNIHQQNDWHNDTTYNQVVLSFGNLS